MKPHQPNKHWIHKFALGFILLQGLLVVSCGDLAGDTGENYGNLLDSPNSLELTEDEHVFGWGRSDCLMCHNLNNIHLVNLTDIELDVQAIQDMTDLQGETVCMNCHGTNGTE